MSKRESCLLVLLLALLAARSAVLPAQQAPLPGWNDNSQPTPGPDGAYTFHTDVRLVLQDITVTDANGKPVTGLKREDFHIFDGGREQTVKSFEEQAPIDPALAEQRQAELASRLPPNTFTNYKAFSGGAVVVFLLDTIEEHGCGSGVDAQMHLRQEMIDYMKSVPLGTPYIILQLDRGLHMVQDMTTDVEALQTAVHGKRDFPELPPQLAGRGSEAADANLRRRQIVTAAMKQLKQYLAAIPGRKNLIWFSSPLYPNLALLIAGVGEWKSYPTFAAYMANITTSLEQSRIAVYHMEGSLVGGSGGWMGPGTGPSENGLPKDPGGINDDAQLEMHQLPQLCAYPQGKERIATIIDRGSRYYTVSYTPTDQIWDGRPRTFRVEMADKTLHLEYRRSYLASLDDTAVQRVQAPAENAAAAAVLHETAGPSPALQTAMGMGTVEPTQVVFEASATRAAAENKDSGKEPPAAGNYLDVKFRKQGYRDYVVHFRVRAKELKRMPASDGYPSAARLEFVAVVYDSQGQAVNGKREKVSANLDSLTDAQEQPAELTGDLTIQVPVKGNYFLRLGVRDVATDRVGALEVPVDRIASPAK